MRLDEEVPHLQLRATATKAGRPDVWPLHAQLATELAAFRPADAPATARVLPDVPTVRALKLDRARAGIPCGNGAVGFADLHSLRMTMNNLLAASGISSRTRQAQLRHADPKLTEVTYFDRGLYLRPPAAQSNRVPAIPSGGSTAQAAAAAGPGVAPGGPGRPEQVTGPGGGLPQAEATEGFLTAAEPAVPRTEAAPGHHTRPWHPKLRPDAA